MSVGLIVMFVVAAVAVAAALIWRQPLLAFAVKSTAYIREVRVEVREGQVNIEFAGENWGCCVSAIVV